jgi:hypothetical protein
MSLDTSRLLLAYRIWHDQCDIDHFDRILRKQGGYIVPMPAGCYTVYIPYRYLAYYLLAYPDLYRKRELDLIV